MCMIDDADGKWDLLLDETRRARKVHRCYECHCEIRPGESYECRKFASDYGVETVTTCPHCVAVRSWLVVQCRGWLYGGVLQDLQEHWQDDDLLRGRYLALAISGMQKRWAKRDGSPMRVMGVYKVPVAA